MVAGRSFSDLDIASWKQTNIAAPEDYQTCRQIMRSASKNYSFASSVFPKGKLHHVEALYAFLRVGDDRVDVSYAGFSSPQQAVEDWERAYWSAFETGASPHPVLRAYLNTAVQCRLPPEMMTAYFRAMKADLTITRYPTFKDLLHYIEGSAMTVGRGMTHILGIRPPHTYPEALPHADALSIAMQLSNFWRDIACDWKMGRMYIPQEDLEHFGVSEADLAARRVTPQFVELLEFEIERTENYYLQARLGVPMLAAGQWGVMSGLEIYRSILNAIRRNHYDVFNRRAAAGRAEKLSRIARAWWHTRGF
jgi:15-cis-phytoene synthase